MLGIFLDIEANGLDHFKHVPVEIAFQIVDMHSGEKKAEYSSLISISQEDWDASDPVSLNIHKISKDQLSKGKMVEQVSEDIIKIFENNGIVNKSSVFICQNPSFDRIFFSKILSVAKQEEMQLPYHWLDLASMYWYHTIMTNKLVSNLTLSKNSIAKSLGLQEEDSPHRAKNGVDHLILCYTNLVGFTLKE